MKLINIGKPLQIEETTQTQCARGNRVFLNYKCIDIQMFARDTLWDYIG